MVRDFYEFHSHNVIIGPMHFYTRKPTGFSAAGPWHVQLASTCPQDSEAATAAGDVCDYIGGHMPSWLAASWCQLHHKRSTTADTELGG